MSDFDYDLPPELIAQDPAPRRDESRLMVLFRDDGRMEHRLFRDIVEYLSPQDVLVVNDTRVIPARLTGCKAQGGAEVEVLLLRPLDEWRWEALVRPGRRLRPGTRLIFGDGLAEGLVEDVTETGGRVVSFTSALPFEEVLSRLGKMPLPPYIKKYPEDPERYQTVYARQEGSAAAPTAGLHFTTELLDRIEARGVQLVRVLLHVGLGTFRPVRVQDITRHHMHAEYYEVTEEAARAINVARARGGRVVAVGTTTTRCLETVADTDGQIRPGTGWTDIFIYPGYRFKAVDALVTNFHLPKSTLLMMVSAFAGREKILHAYRTAVEMRYRFFSFGDAMLIL
ncbi:S-adenosylmethionine:tRNA ribosyltransferase-isomerase [Desulfofundulus luciae]|uniref:S-adenosylmethionine:tRNA ribosyltransferase-isomerase n=1 Tax=Desulfofundulus luciae TaxID=74702 RepID=A0ABU0B3I8_9FIRM|nr:S-adenosylmethionine:tRNA ribosyltransferase-isomerase [Desulfofundulus luciae]